jgi:hypothetical protein
MRAAPPDISITVQQGATGFSRSAVANSHGGYCIEDLLPEHRTVEARGEAFNSLNHPNIGVPGPYPDFAPSYGKAFSAGNGR